MINYQQKLYKKTISGINQKKKSDIHGLEWCIMLLTIAVGKMKKLRTNQNKIVYLATLQNC